MERGINYALIGACFVACLIGFVIFIFWFANSSILSDVKHYKAYSQAAIGGIRPDSLVKYKGINVGRVEDIRFKDNNFDEVEILLSLRADLKVKKNSTLMVEQGGIIGQSHLTLFQNKGESEFIEDSGVLLLQGDNALSQTLNALPELARKIDTLLDNANNIVSEENARNITEMLASLRDTADMINSLGKALELNADNIHSILDNINSAIANTNSIIESVNTKMQSGEYDIKQILTPSLLSLEQSLRSIDELAKSGSMLLDNLQQNPYNTIFGYRESGNE